MNKVLDLRKTRLSGAKRFFKASPIVMIAAGLVVAGGVGATLVSYLSNEVDVETVLGSPVEMSVHTGTNKAANGNPSISIATTGGSNFVFTTVAENKANEEIEGYRVFTVEAPTGLPFVGGEIERVTIEHAWSGGAVDITDVLVVVYADGSLHWLKNWTGSSQKLVLITSSDGGSTATVNTLAASEIDWNTFGIKMHKATAPGTYNIYSQYVNDLAEYATEQYAK